MHAMHHATRRYAASEEHTIVPPTLTNSTTTTLVFQAYSYRFVVDLWSSRMATVATVIGVADVLMLEDATGVHPCFETSIRMIHEQASWMLLF